MLHIYFYLIGNIVNISLSKNFKNTLVFPSGRLVFVCLRFVINGNVFFFGKIYANLRINLF